MTVVPLTGCARRADAAPTPAPTEVTAPPAEETKAAPPPKTAPAAAPAPAAPAEPDEGASAEQIRAFVKHDPDHARARELAARHDRMLLPCPGERAWCTPTVRITAAGVLARAERYLEHCIDCKKREPVTALSRRVALIIGARRMDETRRRFDAAMARRDWADAEQTIADASPFAPDLWKKSAEQWLARSSSRKEKVDESCRVPESIAVLTSPARPAQGAPVRILFTSETPIDGAIKIDVDGPDAPLTATRLKRGGGPPYFWRAEVEAPAAGRLVARLESDGEPRACHRFTVAERALRTRKRPLTADRGWDAHAESLYSSWLELLFDAREGKRWKGLHAVTRNPSRNFLHDHLGFDEDTRTDAKALHLTPDCADNPFFLRAYFAWKLDLPFGVHDCSKNGENGAPECIDWTLMDEAFDTDATPKRKRDHATGDAAARGVAVAVAKPPYDAPADPPHPARQLRRYLVELKDAIQARSLRTALDDDETDLYPVALDRQQLRPGAVFSDPYGHTLTVVKWRPQTEKRAGLLLAVDAQPDGTVGIKRFWRGNFLFPDSHPVGGYGFKAFRPIVWDEVPEEERRTRRLLGNAEIDVTQGYGGFSTAQKKMSSADFYATLAALINPKPLSPDREYHRLHEALHAQLESRVSEIAIAEEFAKERDYEALPMPPGRGIFQTTGPWEALSTPCRDMRLLVGMDVLLAFPDVAARTGASIAELVEKHEAWSRGMTIEYKRSDGSVQVLSMKQMLARQKALEMGYNPNDCPEVRWGAPPNSDEAATCKRRAPEEQQKRMLEYRHWFQKRYSCG